MASMPLFVGGYEATPPRDLWIHPRGEVYDAARHYRDAKGELYYEAENDLEYTLGDVSINPGRILQVRVDLGPDVFEVIERSKGSLLPVILYDRDGDGSVDRTIRGRVEGREALFDAPELERLDLRRIYWQLGVRYVAGDDGDPSLDGRYLASIDSPRARVAYRNIDELPAVGAGPGLVIMKHVEGTPFDFAEFVQHPARYVEDFLPLTRHDDEDDWTVDDRDGRLVTHFDREDLFIVRAVGGLELDVEWGDMPLVAFLEDYLDVPPDAESCYSSLATRLVNHDGSPVTSPQRVFYCPGDQVAFFEAPDGYQIGLSAKRGSELVERTEAGTSVGDNIRLYMRQVNPRSPSVRSTGTVSGNIRAGLRDAGADVKDVLDHTVTGSYSEDIHTGRSGYRASPVTAVPRALWSLVRLRPGDALGEIATGAGSAVDATADVVSAVNNVLVNPVLQIAVGHVASPRSADRVGEFLGALSMAAARNLPGGERSMDALSPLSAWRHNRAFEPTRYTRTDTQLNIDRAMTLIDLAAIDAIERHNDDSSSSSNGNSGDESGGSHGGGGSGSGGGGGGNPSTPPKVNGLGKRTCASPAGKGILHPSNRSANSVQGLMAKFCHHPGLDGLLPTKW
jgi:uncharacterized membrane protein YgcG